MDFTYILCLCNAHKENKSASLIYSFKADEESKVLDYIKTHLNAFFEGTYQEKKERFQRFFKATIDSGNIADAINSNLDIYAMVQVIPTL